MRKEQAEAVGALQRLREVAAVDSAEALSVARRVVHTHNGEGLWGCGVCGGEGLWGCGVCRSEGLYIRGVCGGAGECDMPVAQELPVLFMVSVRSMV